jgi:hypothetical protein
MVSVKQNPSKNSIWFYRILGTRIEGYTKQRLNETKDQAIKRIAKEYDIKEYSVKVRLEQTKQNGGRLSQHIDAAFDAAASGDRGGLTTTKAAIRKALNQAKQPEGQKAREYIFGVLDIIVKNRSKWSGAQTQKAVREYSAAVYGRVLPKLKIEQNPRKTRRHFVDPFEGMSEAAIRAYNDVAKGMSEAAFYKKHRVGDYGQYKETAEKYAGRLFRLKPLKANSTGEARNETTTDFHAKQNPEIMGRYVSEAVLDNVFTELTRYYQSSAKDKKAGLPNLVRYLELKVGGLSERQAKAYIGVMEKHLMPRKNHTASDFHAFKQNRSKEHFKMFQGKQPSGSVRVLQPDSAPKETSRLGDLVLMKVIKSNGSKQNINFDGEAFLAIDLRKNLWAIGKDARINNVALPRKGELKYLGKLKQIDYVTAKKHIGGNKLTRFWHELGEVDKNYPSLYVDADGFPIIHGGGYDVWNIGIVN